MRMKSVDAEKKARQYTQKMNCELLDDCITWLLLH